MLKNHEISMFRLSSWLVFASILGLIGGANSKFVSAEDPVDILVEFESGDIHQVTAQFEHTGVVIVDNAGQDEGARTVPLKVVAKLDFDQRFTGKKQDLQAIRIYRETKADIKIDKGSTKSALSDENRLIVARIQPSSFQRLQMASISDVLKQNELELIRNPADPLSFVHLFNKRNVKTGDKWKISSEAIADFLAVDHVYENEIELVLKSVTKNVAKIHIVGSIKAEVDDVTTEMQVSGFSLIDLEKKQLTAIRTNIRENRSPGQVAPGFEGQTKIALKVSPKISVPELSDDALSKTKAKRIERKLKWESDQGNFQITHDPRWRVIASETDAAVLRYLDNGELLAQCNVVTLPSRPADQPLKLADFKSEVEKIVAAEESADVIDSQELKTTNNLTALRVQVDGIESKVPITWIYYHVANSDGRRLTFAFTMERAMADRFATADRVLVDQTLFKPLAKKTAESEQGRSASKPSTIPNR